MNRVVLILICVLSGLFCLISLNLIYSCIVIYCLIFVSILLVRIDVNNPIVWFVPFIAIYHLSIVFMDELGLIHIYSAREIVMATYIAVAASITTIALFFDNRKRHKNIAQIFNHPISNSYIKTINIIYIFICIISFFLLAIYIRSGVQSKAEVALSGDLNAVLNYIFRVYILLSFIQLIIRVKSKSFKLWSFFNSLYILVTSLITGERDLIFLYIIGVSLILFFSNKIKKTQIILGCLVLLSLIPIMGEYKNILHKSSESKNTSGVGLEKIFLEGEFIAGGRNLNQIIENEREYKWGQSIINDIARAFVPSFIFKTENSVGWFAEKYHKKRLDQGQGLGFSLIAEGYINGGYLGIYIWFTLVSGLIVFLYNRIYDIYSLVLYIYMIPIFIYSLRGDLSTILSPLLKQVIIPIIILKIMFDIKVCNSKSK